MELLLDLPRMGLPGPRPLAQGLSLTPNQVEIYPVYSFFSGSFFLSGDVSMMPILLDRRYDTEYYQQTEESGMFRQEYEMRRMKQVTLLLLKFILCPLLILVLSS